MERFNNAVQLSHHILSSFLKGDEACIDATVGNGCDILEIARSTRGRLFGFDIQKDALDRTESLLVRNGVDMQRVSLFYAGHESMREKVAIPVSLVIFNLGYLPGGNKAITTLPSTTTCAIKASLDLLLPGGLVLITVYTGHGRGKEEYACVSEYVQCLDQRCYNIVRHSFPNQTGNPPELFCMEKRLAHILTALD